MGSATVLGGLWSMRKLARACLGSQGRPVQLTDPDTSAQDVPASNGHATMHYPLDVSGRIAYTNGSPGATMGHSAGHGVQGRSAHLEWIDSQPLR